MITYFPQVYPDELVYSWLARCYVKSGYPTYTYFAEDFFVNKSAIPDVEFLNEYTTAALEVISKVKPIENVLMEHTMFPYYARFITREEREKAYKNMLSNQASYYHIPRFKKKCGSFIKYCPLCANEDRVSYGEAYFHRIHQIDGIEICQRHKCKLLETEIIIGKTSPRIYNAEEKIPYEQEVIYSDNDLECRIADYVIAVFQADLQIENDIAYGEYLHYRLADTAYSSPRGLVRNISLMLNEYLDFYKGYEWNTIDKVSQMQQFFKNTRRNPLEICLLAYFLGIKVDELVNMRMPDISPTESYDNKILRLHEKGLKYTEIARIMGGSYDSVKLIGRGKANKLKDGVYIRNGVGGRKARDWMQFDKDTLPKVQELIFSIMNQTETIPNNASIAGIERKLGLKNGSMKKMPLCKSEIEKCRLSQEELWAKKVVWVVKKIKNEGQPLNWKRIREYTNMRNQNFQDCKQYLSAYAGEELATEISRLL